jgi:hypothetical protein
LWWIDNWTDKEIIMDMKHRYLGRNRVIRPLAFVVSLLAAMAAIGGNLSLAEHYAGLNGQPAHSILVAQPTAHAPHVNG